MNCVTKKITHTNRKSLNEYFLTSCHSSTFKELSWTQSIHTKWYSLEEISKRKPNTRLSQTREVILTHRYLLCNTYFLLFLISYIDSNSSTVVMSSTNLSLSNSMSLGKRKESPAPTRVFLYQRCF